MKPIGIFFSKSFDSLKGNWGMAAISVIIVVALMCVFALVAGLFMAIPTFLQASHIVTIIFAIIASMFYILAVVPLYWAFKMIYLSLIRDGKLNLGLLSYGYNNVYHVTWGYVLIFLCQILVSFALLVLPAMTIAGNGLSVTLTEQTALAQTIRLVDWGVNIYLIILFSQYAYIIYDDDDIRAYGALQRSVELMRGHKLQYFIILLIYTLSIGALLGVLYCLPAYIGRAGMVMAFVLLILFAVLYIPFMETVNAHFYESLEENDEATEETDSDYKEINSNNEEV